MAHKLRYLGTALALAFIGYVMWGGIGDLPEVDLRSTSALSKIALALLAYALSQVIGALAWRWILSVWSVSLAPGRAESQHLVSQIGKYVPGNVGQFVGRFALARQDGVPLPVIGLATLFEIGLLIGTGALLVVGFATCLPGYADALLSSTTIPDFGEAVWIVPGLAACAAIVSGGVLFREMRRQHLPAARPARFAVPVLLYAAGFTVLGISLSLVSAVVAPDTGVSVGFATILFAVAWIAGFVMPGAPGGVGIRDGILAVGLGLVVGDGAGLAVALLHRSVTTVGDVGIFGVGCVVRRST
ncbi:hypothetical protein EF888_05760 [Silicimonas algicola]|uniref:Lysylphosphatidylglycerol synthase-like protein n=1 Tax=Silicimonas algicola TaxID=1826607 RepID=A0A316GEP3_9RHOB|nr:lysylphosphatidylglycerol synthase domain-containing protein [Silicimonas algicola]AZQ66690.1 hypothetical protein EF888_05760 [Silicimonas algicola]PWK59043.1 hypothetical protein C8D95_101865 [Silicimonas algicola]